jgi:hypothetical protein
MNNQEKRYYLNKKKDQYNFDTIVGSSSLEYLYQLVTCIIPGFFMKKIVKSSQKRENLSVELGPNTCIKILKAFKLLTFMSHEIYPCHMRITINKCYKILHSTIRERRGCPNIRMNSYKGQRASEPSTNI